MSWIGSKVLEAKYDESCIVIIILFLLQRSLDARRHIDPTCKELSYNPKYDELFAPVLGPDNPHKSNQQKAHKNTLSGYVERAHMNDFNFESQRRTFHSYGKGGARGSCSV
jgi:hypothetical protein